MKTKSIASSLLIGVVIFSIIFIGGCHKDDFDGAQISGLIPDTDNGGLTLADGFRGISVAGETGRARHIAVNTNGDIYVRLAELKNGTGILVLKDTDNDGRTDTETGFGNFPGTGIAIKGGYLYASSDAAVFRYKLNANNEIENASSPETIASGLTMGSQHSSKSITLDN